MFYFLWYCYFNVNKKLSAGYELVTMPVYDVRLQTRTSVIIFILTACQQVESVINDVILWPLKMNFSLNKVDSVVIIRCESTKHNGSCRSFDSKWLRVHETVSGFFWWLLMTCNSKRDHKQKDCCSYIVIINGCAQVRSHIKSLLNLFHPRRKQTHMPLVRYSPKQLLSEWVARINKDWRFLVVTLRISKLNSTIWFKKWEYAD